MDPFRQETSSSSSAGPFPTPPRSTDHDQQLAQPMDVESPTSLLLYPAPAAGASSSYTLLTAPPVPWPQPAAALETLQLGGRNWPSASQAAPSAGAAAQHEYLQALYLPEAVYPLGDLVHTLADAPASMIVPVAVVSAKHRKVLPELLPSLFSANPPHSVGALSVAGEPSIDEHEWRAFRSGFGIRLGSRGLGVVAKAVEGEGEEDRNERRRSEEERWVRDGRDWVDGLERREILMQVLLHFLLPPPPTALSTAALPKKRSRKPSKAAPAPDEALDLAQSLMAYADRLSIWQALSSLGVDALSISSPKGKERAGSQAPSASVSRRDWVQAFYADVVESKFGSTHPGFCRILTSTLQLPTIRPRSVKAVPSRPAAAAETDDGPNPTLPTPVVWPPLPAAGAPPAASRRKGKAKQLPDDANKYVLAAANAASSSSNGSGNPGARMAHSMSRTHSLASTSASSAAGGSRAFARSTSSVSTTSTKSASGTGRSSLGAADRGRSAAVTILERAASLGPPTSIKPDRANSLGPSAAANSSAAASRPAVSSRSTSFARTSSQGPETQTEKLMRRSVSFTKGAGVGRKPAGGSAGAGRDKTASDLAGVKGEQMKLDGLWGARVSKAGAGEEKGSIGGAGRTLGGAGRRESLTKIKSSVSRLAPVAPSPPAGATSQTLVPETPVKPAPARSLVPDTPVGAMPAFVAETPPASSAPAALLGKAYRLGAAGAGAGWALGRVMEGGEEDGLGEFFEGGSDEE